MSESTERAAFEADAAPMGFDLARQSIAVPEPWAEYADESTGHRWAGWLARAEGKAEPAAATLAGLLRECLEIEDNWPGIAYTHDLSIRAHAALAAFDAAMSPLLVGEQP